MREYKAMYDPGVNSILVQIDDAAAAWGGGNDDSMLGKSFNKGTVINYGIRVATQQYPVIPEASDLPLKGMAIMWNEGTEAGTTFEDDGKLYGFIYWWDVRATKLPTPTHETANP